MPRTGLQWAFSLDRSPMRQHDDLARAQDADLRQSIAAVALEPQIRRGASADLRCYNRKTKDRCPTPTRGLWFSNPSGAAHHLPDLPEGRSFSCADSIEARRTAFDPNRQLSPHASRIVAGAARRQGASP